MNEAFVIDAVRTPIGKYGGVLSAMRPDDLLAHVIRALVQRNPTVDPMLIEDVIAGDANQAGEDNRNVARMAALLAGLPVQVAATTVNRLCASGLQALIDAYRTIALSEGDLAIGCGVESMSRAPYVVPKPEAPFPREPRIFDTTIGWRMTNPRLAERYHPYSMGETAENVARQWKISREHQDEFAFHSQRKYAEAEAAGLWEDEIVAVELEKDRLIRWVSEDEQPRATTRETLSRLKPAFSPEGTVTAGNSSGINDGAAALLLASGAAVKRFDLEPLAVIRSAAVAGVPPEIMGLGPVPASRKALDRAGLSVRDLDLIELNEAFASQALACIQELELDADKVNIQGGAIALGHPLGCSGSRIVATLVHALRRTKGRYGLATLCVGVGQGASVVVENLQR